MSRRAKHISDPSRSLVGFSVGTVRYAVPIKHVREITNPMAVTQLPHAPPIVVGVTDHRGEVITVIDLRIHFGVSAANDTGREKWILLQMAGEPLGLVVDSVTEVFGAEDAELRDAPQVSRIEQQGLLGVLARDEHLVFVLDVDRFVAFVSEVKRGSLPALGAPR
jgi:purine-binding chemotaxis protein CheW